MGEGSREGGRLRQRLCEIEAVGGVRKWKRKKWCERTLSVKRD